MFNGDAIHSAGECNLRRSMINNNLQHGFISSKKDLKSVTIAKMYSLSWQMLLVG